MKITIKINFWLENGKSKTRKRSGIITPYLSSRKNLKQILKLEQRIFDLMEADGADENSDYEYFITYKNNIYYGPEEVAEMMSEDKRKIFGIEK